ncbi:hypothetical protein OC846_005788 [Tilletia horrida]|uniref:AMP-dependent synthetase/ligase domain-containing protein n=1 Tax=Tilletia horrida TaxID=155126 RepID=A0AAN6GL39_9BASI|nr:hypothetical protein OC846_005788 [Tilletia horrida]KAK0563418.1 hypothetical protein OC861_004815 [Tilletia horrida]
MVPNAVGLWPAGGKQVSLWDVALVDVRTAASISKARLYLDALRIARSLRDGNLLTDQNDTVLIHLPNCLAFAPVLLGSLTSAAKVVLVDHDADSEQLGQILSRSRPQVIVTTIGTSGEDKVGNALLSLQEGSNAANGWARELIEAHKLAATARLHPSETVPFHVRRIWTVNVNADYYGSSFLLKSPSMPVPVSRTDSQDWSVLLLPPPGHKHTGNQEPDQVEGMNLLNQQPRLPFGSKEAVANSSIVTITADGQWQTWSITQITSMLEALGPRLQSSRSGTWPSAGSWTSAGGLFGHLLASISTGSSVLVLPKTSKGGLTPDQLSSFVNKHEASLVHIDALSDAKPFVNQASSLRTIIVSEDTEQDSVGAILIISIGRLLRQHTSASPLAKL